MFVRKRYTWSFKIKSWLMVWFLWYLCYNKLKVTEASELCMRTCDQCGFRLVMHAQYVPRRSFLRLTDSKIWLFYYLIIANSIFYIETPPLILIRKLARYSESPWYRFVYKPLLFSWPLSNVTQLWGCRIVFNTLWRWIFPSQKRSANMSINTLKNCVF